jgi:hypothetical protein
MDEHHVSFQRSNHSAMTMAHPISMMGRKRMMMDVSIMCVSFQESPSGFVERSQLNAQENPLSQEHPLSLGEGMQMPHSAQCMMP